MRQRRFYYFLILSIFCLAATSPSFAQDKRVGTVDSQKVLEDSDEGKRILAQLQERDQKASNELAKMDEDIRKLETKLNTQRLTLSEESIIQMSSDLERKRTDRKRLAEDSMRDFQELQFRLFNRLQNELMPIISQIGKERGYEMIFDLSKSGAIYYDQAVNLTDEVIKRYNASKATKK